MCGSRPNVFWLFCWKYISPIALVVVFITNVHDLRQKTAQYSKYVGCEQVCINHQYLYILVFNVFGEYRKRPVTRNGIRSLKLIVLNCTNSSTWNPLFRRNQIFILKKNKFQSFCTVNGAMKLWAKIIFVSATQIGEYAVNILDCCFSQWIYPLSH